MGLKDIFNAGKLRKFDLETARENGTIVKLSEVCGVLLPVIEFEIYPSKKFKGNTFSILRLTPEASSTYGFEFVSCWSEVIADLLKKVKESGEFKQGSGEILPLIGEKITSTKGDHAGSEFFSLQYVENWDGTLSDIPEPTV